MRTTSRASRPSRWSSCARAAKASRCLHWPVSQQAKDKTIDMEAGDTVIIRPRRCPATRRPSRRWSTRWPRSAPMCTKVSRPRACVRSCIGRGTEDHADHRTAQGVHAGARRGHHLRAHARLAEAVGVPAENVFICENGESLSCPRRASHGEFVQSGIVLVDGLSVGDTSEQGARRAHRRFPLRLRCHRGGARSR